MSCDLYMEHENRAAKDDITSAKGKFRGRECLQFWMVTCQAALQTKWLPGQVVSGLWKGGLKSNFTKSTQKGKKKRLNNSLCTLYVPFSGVGAHVKGYVGHGDAKWEEQVVQGVEMMKVFWFLSHWTLKGSTFDRTPWMRNLDAQGYSTRKGARRSGPTKTLKLLSGPGFNHFFGNTQKSLMTSSARPLPG